MNATATAPITPDAEHILRALLADPEPRTYGATTVTSLLAEIDRLRPLLADTAGHLAVIHRHAGRHRREVPLIRHRLNLTVGTVRMGEPAPPAGGPHGTLATMW